MYGGKKVCPNCGQPQEKNWDKCPFCVGMGGMTGMGAGGGPPMGGAPMGGAPMGGGYGGGGYGAPAGGGGAAKTMMIGTGAAAPGQQMQLLGWIVPLKGAHRGELHTLKPQSVIGKDPTCDIVFNDSFMSSRHATIRAQNGVFVLEDHSTNGTFVNDKKISRQELLDNDFVKFGQTLVKFKTL
jgi:FHA domain-containing protein